MDELIKRIQKEADVDENGIIRVDMFLNHQLDVDLLENIGAALAKRFKSTKVDKVLTAESSGIAIAIFVAKALKVPAIYAKKFQTGFIDPNVYSTQTHSFALDKSYTLRVSKRYLEQNDRVLVVDDILSNGQAVLGMLELIAMAQAETVGVGVAIEKADREGGQVLRRMGLKVEALVTVQRAENGQISFL